MVRAPLGGRVMLSSIGGSVVYMKMIEMPRRPVAPELCNVDLAGEIGSIEQVMQRSAMLIAHRLFNAISAEALRVPAQKEPRFVNRIAECLAGIAQDHQVACLCHEGAHMTDRALDDDIAALQRNSAA